MNEQETSFDKIRMNQRLAIKSALEKCCRSNATLHNNGFGSILVNFPRPNPLDMIAGDYEKSIWETPRSSVDEQSMMSQTEVYILAVNDFINKTLEGQFTQLIKDIDMRMKKLESFNPSHSKDKPKKVIQMIEMWTQTKFLRIDEQLFDSEVRYEAEGNKEDFKQRLRALQQRFQENQLSKGKQEMIKKVAEKFSSTYEYLVANPKTERKPQRLPSKYPPNPWMPAKRHSILELVEVFPHDEQRRIFNQAIEKIELEKSVIIAYWKDDLRLLKPKLGAGPKEFEEERRPAIMFGFALKLADPNKNPRIMSLIPRLALYPIDFDSVLGFQIESMESSTGYRALMSCSKMENIAEILESYINNYTDDATHGSEMSHRGQTPN